MNMGVFDLPAPVLSWVEHRLSMLIPAVPRLLFWSAFAAVFTMLLYWKLSPQARIAQVKQDLDFAKQRLDRYEGDMQDAWPLMRNMLAHALRQIALVLGPTVLAGLPVLFVLVWVSNTYDYRFPPPAAPVAVTVQPAEYAAQWLGAAEARQHPHIVVQDQGRRSVGEVEVRAPVAAMHKRQWWNWLIANPAGYLPDDAPFERLQMELPQARYLPWGPDWMRGWEFLFLGAMMIVALGIKLVFRIH